MDPISNRIALGAAGGGAAGYEGAVAMAINSSSTSLVVQEFSAATGWGTRYTKSTHTYGGDGVSFTPDGNAIIITGSGSSSAQPSMRAYAWNSPGFGSEYSQGANMPQQGGRHYNLHFNPSGSYIAYGRSGTRTETVSWSNGFTGTKHVPSSYPSGQYEPDPEFSPDGNWIAAAHERTSSYHLSLNCWSWSDSTGFGSTYSYLGSGTPSNRSIATCAWTTDSAYVIGGFSESPFIRAWPWNAPGFGTEVSDPSTLPSTCTPVSMCVSPDNDAILIADASGFSPYIHAWEWTGSGFGAKYSNPSSLPTQYTLAAAFSNDASLVCVVDDNGRAHMYPWSGSTGFGVRYTLPTVLPDRANQISFQPYSP